MHALRYEEAIPRWGAHREKGVSLQAAMPTRGGYKGVSHRPTT